MCLQFKCQLWVKTTRSGLFKENISSILKGKEKKKTLTSLICCTANAFPPLLEVGSEASKPRNSPESPNNKLFANMFSKGIPSVDATGYM